MSYYVPKVTIHSNRVLSVISKLKIGDIVTADVIEKLDGNYYLISIYGVIFRAYSIVKLIKKAKFKVVSTKPYLMLIPLDAVVKYLTVDDYITSTFNFPSSENQLVRAIIKSFLKYNLPLDNDNILIYFNLFKDELIKDEYLISLLISIMEKKKEYNSDIIKTILKYNDIVVKLKNYLRIFKDRVYKIYDEYDKIIYNNNFDFVQYILKLILENKHRQIYFRIQNDDQLGKIEIAYLIDELIKIENILSIHSDEIESYNYFSIPLVNKDNISFAYCKSSFDFAECNNILLQNFNISCMIQLSRTDFFSINIQYINRTINAIIQSGNDDILNNCIKNQSNLEKIISSFYKPKDILLDFQLKNINSNYQHFLEELEDEYLIPIVNTTI